MHPLIELCSKMVAPVARRVANLVGRGVVSASDDSTKMQLLKVSLLDGEVRDEVERFQSYGFTSNPPAGAEAVVVFVGGRRDHGLAIQVDDRRYRIKSLESGSVAVYNDTGAKIVLRASGDIEITPKAGQTLKIASNVEVTGTLTASVDVVGGGKHLKTHTHTMTPAQSPIAVSGTVGSISGVSGAPS